MRHIALLLSGFFCLSVHAQTDSLKSFAPAQDDRVVAQADTTEVNPAKVEPEVTVPGKGYTLFSKGSGAPVDTIDVGDRRIRIVLRDDNTWFLIKNIEALEQDEQFSSFWNTNIVNPYAREPFDSIHYRTTLCLVDSVSRFVCPHKGKVFSKFGMRHGRPHTGCDIPYPTGTPVYCAFDGRVRLAERHRGYGNLIIVRHENGLETFYGHLSRIDVKPGQWVHAGDLLGLGGSTGRSSGPHLHFETRYRGHAFDPLWIVDFESGTLRKNVFVLRRSYLSAYSKYVPQTIDEEEEIYMSEEQIRAEEERLAKERAAMKYHTIRSGDTLSGLAKKYGTTVSHICSLNPGLKPTTTLSLGRKIRVH